jgi:hypothetical protein
MNPLADIFALKAVKPKMRDLATQLKGYGCRLEGGGGE